MQVSHYFYRHLDVRPEKRDEYEIKLGGAYTASSSRNQRIVELMGQMKGYRPKHKISVSEGVPHGQRV